MQAREPVHHAARVEAAIASGEAAKSAVVASWRRSSRLHLLDPAGTREPARMTDAELVRTREQAEPLLNAARPVMDRLHQAVGASGCSVLLADANGVPFERRGSQADDAAFKSWGLWTGAIWSEEHEGTNGIDVSSCRADRTDSFGNLITLAVVDAARRIEAEMFCIAFAEARIVLTPARDGHVGGLLAVDDDDLVIGATRSARLAIGISPDRVLRPIPANDLLCRHGAMQEHLGDFERGVLQRALLRAHGNVTAAAKALGVSRATLHRRLKRFDLGSH